MLRAININTPEGKMQKRKYDLMTGPRQDSFKNDYALLKSKKNSDFSAVKSLFGDFKKVSNETAKISISNNISEQRLITCFYKPTKRLYQNANKETDKNDK